MVRKPGNYGFTLLEIMASVVIIGILAAGVVMSFSQPLAKARETEFRDYFVSFQNQLRNRARTTGQPVSMIVKSNEIIVENEQSRRTNSLGKACRIDAIYTKEGNWFSGREIAIDIHGVSESFAVNILPKKSKGYWLLIVGGSGEAIELENLSQVKKVFADYEIL